MIILIPLVFLALVFGVMKWVFTRMNSQSRLYLAAISAGWGGYGLVGVLVPHVDPQTWHYLTAPAFGGLVLVIGWVFGKGSGATI
jgi:uncharacterized membrane protein